MKLFDSAIKQEVRQRIFGVIEDTFGPMVFNERQFITLGGPQVNDDGSLVKGTELYHLHQAGLFDKEHEHNYISVEKNRKTHKQNLKYKGPSWELGTFRKVWFDYHKDKDFMPAVVHADLMTGIKAAKPTIFSIIENPPCLPRRGPIYNWRALNQCVLFVINVLKSSLLVKNMGAKINNRPRHSLERMVRWQEIKKRMNVDLVDSLSYDSTCVTKMQTLIYRLSPL